MNYIHIAFRLHLHCIWIVIALHLHNIFIFLEFYNLDFAVHTPNALYLLQHASKLNL